jgi:condensin complex subunit 1
MDLIAGTNEDDFTEAIQHIRERELLYGQTSLLSSFGPLVAEVCANNTTYPDPTLQSQAALCMAKLMCVSSEYCEHNLSLLITILERSKDATVRSNLVVALGDMAVCFNHLIDENTDFLYRRLNDADVSVKRTCLMTLTFLILAGQVKVKGQLGEMAKCTEDADRRIRDMSRMFFTELATKDNAVYNHFVDMFSLLSADRALEEDAFRRIIKFLLGFIEKVHALLNSILPTISLLRITWANFCARINTPNNLPTNLRRDYSVVIMKGSGMMLPSRWACCSTRTRRLLRLLMRGLKWSRLRRKCYDRRFGTGGWLSGKETWRF